MLLLSSSAVWRGNVIFKTIGVNEDSHFSPLEIRHIYIIGSV